MKALVKVGYGCNNNCLFCHTLDLRHVAGSADEVHRKIGRAADLGYSMVVLSGGEPTMRRELLGWAEHAASLGLDFGLVTNGRMLSYRELVDRLLEHRLRYVYVSIHGATAAVHDRLVRAHDAFEQTVRAIDNLVGRVEDLTANCVVTRQNVDHLADVAELASTQSELRLTFSFVEAKGGGRELFEQLVPDVSYAAGRVGEVLAAAGEGARLSHGAFPLCLMPGAEHRYDDLRTHGFRAMTEADETDFFPVDDLNRIQPEDPCSGCALRGPCPGLYRGYHEARGSGELRAVSGPPRVTSVRWDFDAQVAAGFDDSAGHAACPIFRDGVTPWDRGRHLFIAASGAVLRLYCASRDLTDAEIARVKLEEGTMQLADASGLPLQAAPLSRSRACTGCPERHRCTGLFVSSDASAAAGVNAVGTVNA